MKLLNLKLRNFRQHADSEITFPERGVIGIVGSNEGGKSTILEAVAWALYGSRATRGTARGIRWNRAPARHVAEAHLRFEVGGQIYRIERTENNAALFREGQPVPIAAGIDAVNQRVPELLGMALDEFTATYLCRQKDLGRIAAMGGTERRQFFLQVLGVERVDEALAKCRRRKSEIARELDGLRQGLGDREPIAAERDGALVEVSRWETEVETAAAALEEARTAEAATAAALAESDARRREHDRLVLEHDKAGLLAESAAKEVDRLAEELRAAEAAAETAAKAREESAPLPVLSAELANLRLARVNAERAASLREMAAGTEREIERLRGRIRALEAVVAAGDREALEATRAAFREVEDRLQRLRSGRIGEQQATRAAIEQAGKEAERVRRRIAAIEQAGAAGACPTCARPLGEQFHAVLDALRGELAEIEARREELSRKLSTLGERSDDELAADIEREHLLTRGEQLRDRVVAAERAAEELEQTRASLADAAARLAAFRTNLEQLGEDTFDAGRLAAVEAEIMRLEALSREAERAQALADRAPEIREYLDRWIRRRDEAAAARDQAAARLAELAFDRETHAELGARLERQRANHERAVGAYARAQEGLRAARARLERAERALAVYDSRAARLEDLARELRTHEAAADRLADFRTAIAAGIRPELEELMSGFLQILTDGRHEAVTVTENFDVILQEGGLEVEVVSGGTEDVAAIAMRLAVSQMIAERAGHPLSLLVLDEPFGSLDEVRRGNVLSLIRRLGGVFEQVLVISHVAETRDAVDAVIEVEYDEAAGRSRIRQPAEAAAPVVAAEAA
jgi:exonuclease SbcC